MPEYMISFEPCSKCHGTDTVSLVFEGRTAYVTWCACGHIHIRLDQDMDVSILCI